MKIGKYSKIYQQGTRSESGNQEDRVGKEENNVWGGQTKKIRKNLIGDAKHGSGKDASLGLGLGLGLGG